LREGASGIAAPVEQQTAEADASRMRFGRVGVACDERTVELDGLVDLARTS
jgi:hypothetical protein